MSTSLRIAFLLAAVAVLVPESALAYGGPGSVISGIGAFLAAVAAILATLFGFIWFPLKRLCKSWTEEETPAEEAAISQPSE
jgi:succinate-acetate transporter protein